MALPLVTVGHGTAGRQQFGDLLSTAGITHLVDVRRFPGSRRDPHLSREALGEWLPAVGIVIASGLPGHGGPLRRRGCEREPAAHVELDLAVRGDVSPEQWGPPAPACVDQCHGPVAVGQDVRTIKVLT